MYGCEPHVCTALGGLKILWNMITDDCELPCECWKPNLGPLHQQQVLLTAEPFSSPLSFIFEIGFCYGFHDSQEHVSS